MMESPKYWALKYFTKASGTDEKIAKNVHEDSKEFYDEIRKSESEHVDNHQDNFNNNKDEKFSILIDKKLVKDFFLCCDNGKTKKVQYILKNVDNPAQLLNIIDDYSWTPLMCACASNSVDLVNILIEFGALLTIAHQDPGGNSAITIASGLENQAMLSILKGNKFEQPFKNCEKVKIMRNQQFPKISTSEPIFCNICNLEYREKETHQSSINHIYHETLKIPNSNTKLSIPQYAINKTNIGYKMLKAHGWNSDAGLGLDQKGRLYPIKVNKKNDRSGLGVKTNKPQLPLSPKITNQFSKSDEYEFRRSFM